MITGSSARLFVGFAVADPVRDRLAAQIAPLHATHNDVAWTRTDGWHVTLAFCGDVDVAGQHRLHAVVTDIAPTMASVALTAHHLHPLGRRALVVALADSPRGQLAAAGASLQRSLAERGVPVRHRDVVAHVTLGRARANLAAFDACVEDAAAVDLHGIPPWRPPSLVVWRSQQGDGPARYDVDFEVALSS